MINMGYKQDSTTQCKEKINSLSNGYMFETSDANFRHIEEELKSLSKRFDSYIFQLNAQREPEIDKSISSLKLKVTILSDLITKNPEDYVSPTILKALLERFTMQNIFQKGDSIIIEVLPNNTLKIYGEQPRESA